MEKKTSKVTAFTLVVFLFINLSWNTIVCGSNPQDDLTRSRLAYLNSYEENEWLLAPDPPFSVRSMTGNPMSGVVVFGGIENKQGAFLKDIAGGQWEIIADAPFTVNRSAGDNEFGPIVFGGDDNRQVAYMRRYTDNAWNTVSQAPFVIADIAGDNEFGLIIVGGENKRKVAYMRRYTENKWYVVTDAPFEVEVVSGDNEKGIIIAGGMDRRKVAYMRSYEDNNWQVVSDAPFPIIDLAGTNHAGPVVVGGEGDRQVAYMDNYQENKWRVGAPASIPAFEISGTNDQGIVVSGGGQSRIKTIVKKVYKTAVVEFTERGDLGIPDAGAIVAEWITTSLNKTDAFEVYERLSLSSLMEEHKLGATGMMDEETMAQIGRVRGVQAIVTGSVIKFGDIVSVTAKVVDVETAKIINSADIKVNNINAISSEIDKLAYELAKH